MGNSKYIKSYSNYVLRKKYQNVSGGTIFERDWTTIGGTNKFTAGQVPIYASSNFKITINNTANPRRKFKYGQWKKNSNNEDVWTWENVSGATSDTIEQNQIVLKNNYTSLSDFAYFGSCSELVRASITDIIIKFPAELYFSNQKIDYVDINGDIQYLDGYMVENPFKIDINTKSVIGKQNANLMRYMCQSYDKYVVIDDKNPDNILPVIGVTITVNKLDCIQNGNILSTTVISTKDNKYTIKRIFINNDVYFLSDTSGIRIRPNDEIIEEFFANLDYFQEVLLNRQTNYRAIFDTPYDTSSGTFFTKNIFQWKTVHGWNLDIEGINFTQYLNKLTEIAQYYDNTISDNLYRAMTHEAIKNFDWSYSRKEDEELTAEYIAGGTKIEKLIHIFGRQFDELKRYVDGIKSVNNITYGSKNDLPNYFLTDSLNLAGFNPSEVLYSEWYDNDAGVGIITDVMYPGENDGYVAQEVENNFMRRFRINLKNILRAKGTKKSIEMLLSMFGVPRDWYSFKEYVYFANDFIPYQDCGTNLSCISSNNPNAWVISKLNKYNLSNESTDEEDDYQGLMVQVLNKTGNNIQLYPWFDKKQVYNGNPYFQSAGGWGKSGNTYQETIKYLNIIDTLDELSSLPVTGLENGDVYYVNNQYSYYILKNINFSTNTDVNGYEEGWRRVDIVDTKEDLALIPTDILSAITDNEFYVISEEKYYKLVNINDHCDIINGWQEVSGKSASEDVLKILYLDSIIDNNEGNNPHVGYGNYDGGQDFLNYYRELFKYSLENNKFDESLNNSILSGASIESQGFTITQYEDNKKCWYFNSDEYGYSIPRVNFIHKWQNSSNTPALYFEFMGTIPSGGTLPEYSPNGYNIGDVFHLINSNEDQYYRMVSLCYKKNGNQTIVSYNWNNIAQPPRPYSGDWIFWENKGINSYTDITGSFYPELLINVKKFGIYVEESNIPSSYLDEFRLYFDKILIPFIKELVPSTAILEFGSSLTVFKESVILMPSTPTENVLIDSSDDWNVSGSTGVYKVTPNHGQGGGTNVNVSYTNFGKRDIIFSNGKQNGVLNVMSIDINTSASGSSVSFTAMSQAKTITVNAKGGDVDYVIESIPSWCHYTKNGNKLTITADTNTTESKREGVVILNHINSNKCSTNFKVEQVYSEFNITITPTTNNIPVSGGTILFTVGLSGGTHNNDFNIVSYPSWCSLTKKSSLGRSVLTGEAYLEAKILENNTSAERNGEIVISHIDSISSMATALINQSSPILDITVSPTSFDFPQSGGSKTFTINAIGGSGGYRVLSTEGNWFTYSSGPNNTLVVIASANSATNQREGKIIVVHSDDSTKLVVISLNQASGYSIQVTPDDVSFPQNGGIIDFNVTVIGGTSKDFKVNLNVDWLTVKSKTDNKLTLEASSNGDLPRSTSVNIVHPNSPTTIDTIIISQAATFGLTVEPQIIDAEISGGTYYVKVDAIGGDYPDYSFNVPNLPDWLEVVKVNGGINIIVTRNSGTTDRIYNQLEIYNVNQKAANAYVTINQKAATFNISVNPTSINAPYTSTNEKLIFTLEGGNSPMYIVKDNPISTWAAPSQTSNTEAILYLSENLNGDRNGIITFAHSEDESKIVTLPVKQEGLSIDASPTNIKFAGEGGTSGITFTISGPNNSTFIIKSNPSWVSITKVDDTHANIKVNKNSTNNDLNGVIVFAHSLNQELVVNVNVTQELFTDISVIPSTLEFDSTGGTQNASVTIIGGVNPTYTVVSKPDWITISNTGNATGNTTISITASNNESGSPRNGSIVLAHSLNNNKKVTIQVTQLFLLDLILENCTTTISGVTFPWLIEENKTINTSVDEQGGTTKFEWNQDVVSFDLVISGNSSYNGTAEIDKNNPKVINVSALGKLDVNATSIILQNVKFANSEYVVELVVNVMPLMPSILSVSPNITSKAYPYQFKREFKLCTSSDYCVQAPIYVQMNASETYTVKFDIPIHSINDVGPANVMWYYIGGAGTGQPDRWNWTLKYSLSSDKKTMTLAWDNPHGETDYNVTCHVWNIYKSVTFSNGAQCYFLVNCKNPHM